MKIFNLQEVSGETPQDTEELVRSMLVNKMNHDFEGRKMLMISDLNESTELSNFKKRRTMFTWCRKRKADIIILQETRSTIKTDTRWKNEWGAEIITCHGSSNSGGVAILSKNGLYHPSEDPGTSGTLFSKLRSKTKSV